MKFLLGSLLLNAAAAVVVGRQATQPSICTKSSSIASALTSSQATSFCKTFLGSPDPSVETTITYTPSPITTTESITGATIEGHAATNTNSITMTTIDTQTETVQDTRTIVVTTSSISATSVDCISNISELMPYVITQNGSQTTNASSTTFQSATSTTSQSSSVDQKVDKRSKGSLVLVERAAAVTNVVPDVLKDKTKAQRSNLCQCNPLTAVTRTSTTTYSLSPSTQTVTSTNTMSTTATATAKTTEADVLTAHFTTTLTLNPTTITVTKVTVTPTPSFYAGLIYYVFSNDYDYSLDDPGFDATTFQSSDYKLNGTISDVNDEHTVGYPSGSPYLCNLPNGEYDECDQVTIVNQGYLHATKDGVYQLASDNTTDSGMYVWSGETSHHGYEYDNADYVAESVGGNHTSGSASYNVTAGSMTAITIMWVNGGGPGKAQISVTDPSGFSSGTAGHFIPACPAVNPFSP